MNIRTPDILVKTSYLSIRRKLLFLFGISIVLLFTVIWGVNYAGIPGVYRGEYRLGKEEAIQRLAVIADDRKNYIIQWVGEHYAGMKIASSDDAHIYGLRKLVSAFHSAKGAAGGGYSADWLSSLRDAYHYDAVDLIDSASGRRIFSTDEDQAGSRSPVAENLFSGGTDWTEKIFIAKGDRPGSCFIYLARLEWFNADVNGTTPPAALLFRLDMEDPDLLEVMHESKLLGDTGEIVLVDMQKRILAPLKDKLPDGTSATVLDYRLPSRDAEFAAWGTDGVIEALDYRNKPVIAAVRHHRLTPEFGIGIIVKQDESEVFAQVRSEVLNSVGIASAGLVILMFVFYFITAALLKPLETLRNAVSSIQAGDLEARVHVAGSDECGVLAGAFNRMADNIQQWHREFEAQVASQTEEIRELNTELEQRVTERTAQLEAANKELEAFCYSVSHDLRAPLRHIDGYVELLVSRCHDSLSEKGIHYLDTIADSARRMGALIDDLLHFSRTGRAEMNPSRVDMGQLVEECRVMLQESSGTRRIDWEIACLPAVRGDAPLLRQVWANLLGNAVKYSQTRESARIEVASSDEPRQTVFMVRDNGVGFDMQYADKLFGVFQRLHSQDEFEGTGIGLATVQRIISRHGGRVWAEASPGNGASFYFSIPKQ